MKQLGGEFHEDEIVALAAGIRMIRKSLAALRKVGNMPPYDVAEIDRWYASIEKRLLKMVEEGRNNG